MAASTSAQKSKPRSRSKSRSGSRSAPGKTGANVGPPGRTPSAKPVPRRNTSASKAKSGAKTPRSSGNSLVTPVIPAPHVPGRAAAAAAKAGPSAVASSKAKTTGSDTRHMPEPVFTMILRGHQNQDVIPTSELGALKAGSAIQFKNPRGLMSRGGPPSTRTMEVRLAKDPEQFPSIDDLLAKHSYREIFPMATSTASAAQHYRSVFSRNANAPVSLLTFKKEAVLVDAP